MKQLLLFISIVFCVLVHAQDIPIPPKPNPPRLVNDYADQLTPEQEEALERKLVAYDDSTSNQIAVVIMKNLGGYEPEVFATELGQRWGVGGSKFDNGIVILVSMGNEEESRKGPVEQSDRQVPERHVGQRLLLFAHRLSLR